MGQWRYYALRPSTGEWLDTNVQLSDPVFTYATSAPNSGKATIPDGLNSSPFASDGRLTWSKWDTVLFAEEDQELSWVGICTAANPTDKGLALEFIGINGWLQGVPYNGVISVWETNVFQVIRLMIQHSKNGDYEPGFDFTVTSGASIFTVGDPEPPPKPKQPNRRKNETKKEYAASDRYKDWKDAMEDWKDRYGDREKYEIAWFEAAYIGEEIDAIAAETGIDYLERVRWVDRDALTYRFHLDLYDNLARTRDDIEFVTGVNVAEAIDPKDTDQEYASRVIALGAGEGRKMLRKQAGGVELSDGRIYQAQYRSYKSVRKQKRLLALARRDVKRLANVKPTIDSVVAWDVPAYAPLSSVRQGDVIRVVSRSSVPEYSAQVLIKTITRSPNNPAVVFTVEVVA